MTVSQAMGLAACVCMLALTLLCVARTSHSPLAQPLALLCLVISGWTGAGVAFERSHLLGWWTLDHSLTPLTAPLMLRFVLVFVGKRHAHRATLAVAFVAGGALTAIVGLAPVLPVAEAFARTPAWAFLLLALSLPTVAFALIALTLHLRATRDPVERARTWLLLTSFLVGTLLAATEELSHLLPIQAIGNLGIAVGMVPLTLVALRFRLFERNVSLRATIWFLALAGLGTVVALVVWEWFDANVAIAVVGSGILSIALVAASRRWLSESSVRQARIAQLATVGRFSAQMAHDLKNPLAALKGAAQVLLEDLAKPSDAVDRRAFVELMLAQIDRLDALVDTYGRLARVDPARVRLDTNTIVQSVLAMQAFAAPGVEVQMKLAPDLPGCRADHEMLTRALENLVRNAIEAMPSGGSLTVSTERSSAAGQASVVIAVEDTGQGMDARTRDRAFDDFFTTKARGSGLGLAFVRRFADAHGGDVDIASTEGRGTVVALRLPLD